MARSANDEDAGLVMGRMPGDWSEDMVRSRSMMESAPPGAIYLVPEGTRSLHEAMARECGRGDLVIKTPIFCEEKRWEGCGAWPVVDHKVVLTGPQAYGLREWQDRARSWGCGLRVTHHG